MNERPTQSDVTQLIELASEGDQDSLNQLIPLIYTDLKRLASSIRRKNMSEQNTYNTTSLVNEAWLKIKKYGIHASSKKHFFCIAAKAMRQILINSAKRKLTQKRQGHAHTWDDQAAAVTSEAEWLIQLDEIIEAIESSQKRLTEVFQLKYFLGMPESDIADALNINIRTVRRDWHAVKQVVLEATRSD